MYIKATKVGSAGYIYIVVHTYVTIIIIDKRGYRFENEGAHERDWKKKTWEEMEGRKGKKGIT